MIAFLCILLTGLSGTAILLFINLASSVVPASPSTTVNETQSLVQNPSSSFDFDSSDEYLSSPTESDTLLSPFPDISRRSDPVFAHEIDNIWHGTNLDPTHFEVNTPSFEPITSFDSAFDSGIGSFDSCCDMNQFDSFNTNF